MRCWHFQHLRREVRALQERRQQNKREPQQHTKTTPTLFYFLFFVFFCLLGNRRKDASNLHKFVYSCNKSGRIHAGHDENSHTHTYNLIFFKRPSVLWLRFVREFVCRSFVGVRVQQDNTLM
jgi:hypothetical protein